MNGYRVIALDECYWHEPEERCLTPVPLPENIAVVVGQVWLKRFPDDIVMLVEARSRIPHYFDETAREQVLKGGEA